ncbi:hypothetical protein EJ08DRAFT_693286 [Tothia fuscella]|uniref:THO complex subunit 2 n=1 Tax=Tothia fuscella TaxID=1048955 RepID=A0A9P4P031_9PEZI|nr:hypothetical protein EJ08DRAFT_693286 [Tothia fuscella]
MAPGAKRKRGDRTYSQDSTNGGQRASPHRPENLNLAQHGNTNGGPGRGGRRPSRGGLRGGSAQPRSPGTGANTTSSSKPTSPMASNAMDPPPPPPKAAAAIPKVESPTEMKSTTDKLPYHYSHVTDERKQNWRASGRNGVIDELLRLVEQEDDITLGVIFEELIVAAISGRLTGDEVGSIVKEALEKPGTSESIDIATQFLDALSIVAEGQQSTEAGHDAHPLILGAILRSSGISPSLIREILDVDVLQACGFVRNTFGRMGIRVSTNMLYRQSAFNLLREESEGYSKLITEYFTVTGGLDPTKEVVEETYEKIKALIGAFDLDVGRVLDVTLDVFANNLIRHHRFFIKFLRISCWWPEQKSIAGFEHDDHLIDSLPLWAAPDCAGSDTTPEQKEQFAMYRQERDIQFWDRVREIGSEAFFELGGRRAIAISDMLEDESGDTELIEVLGDKGEKKKDRLENDQGWTRKTKTFPPRGNSTAAQLLGFKLRFYAGQARDANDTLPENLIWVAALLIKIGFISFRDLYPHLYPLDEDMGKLRDKLEAEKRARKAKHTTGAKPNALQAAGALPEDDRAPIRLRGGDSASTPRAGGTGTTNAEATAEQEKLPEPEDQKIHLLRSLLLIGAIPEALYILGKFPWLLDVYPDLPQYLCRILHHSLQKVAQEARPLSDRDSLRSLKKIIYDSSSMKLPKGQLFHVDRPHRKTLKWASLEKTEFSYSNSDYGVDYKFYWDDWADDVPICQNVDDVFGLCDSLLNLLNVKIGLDPGLLTILARIGKRSVEDDESESNMNRWIKLSTRLLVPALSLAGKNAGVVGEVWALLQLFPLHVRYSIYAQWHKGIGLRYPDIKEAFKDAEMETKSILKRMSKTTIRPMGRAFAKICCGSPTVVFQTAISQIESYSNQIESLVDMTKYVSPMTYDVMTWSLLEALGTQRSRLQGDGMLTSPWLNALSTLCGKTFRKYSMDPAPILSYLKQQLIAGSSAELDVLIQLVVEMGGIRPDTIWTDEQTLAMSGKSTLQTVVLKQMGDARSECRTSAKKLIRTLTGNNIAGELVVGIARTHQMYPFSEEVEDAPTKVLGSNISKIYEALIQYLDFLRTNLSVQEFDAAVPTLTTLIQTYDIEPKIAFTIFRPSIQHHMEEADKANSGSNSSDGGPSPTKPSTIGDVDMKDSPTALPNGLTNGSDDVKMEDSAHGSDPSDGSEAPLANKALHPILRDMMNKLKEVMPEDFGNNMSMSFYVRFWQSSLYDMIIPPYDTEIKKINAELTRLAADKSDTSRDGMRKIHAEKNRLNAIKAILIKEAEEHKKHRIRFEYKINSSGEPAAWFSNFPPMQDNPLPDGLLQDCIIPRVNLSPTDALFTAKFLFFVHKIGTPNFPTLELFDHFFREKQLLATIYMCTEKEAKSLGVFMFEVFVQFRKWHSDEAVYIRDGTGTNQDLPGFIDQYHNDGPKHLDFEEFKQRFTQWHLNTFNAIKACLDNEEYMHRRNAFQVLKQVHTQFPLVNFHGTKIESAIATIIADKDCLKDILTSGASILSDIRKRKATWIPMTMMRTVNPSTGEKEKPDSPPPSADTNTKKPAVDTQPALNAKAPEFKPTTSTTNGVRPSGTVDAEDGEIDDSKEADKTSEPMQGIVASATPAHVRQEHPARSRTPDTSTKASTEPAPRQGGTKTDSRPTTPAGSAAPPAVNSASRDSNRNATALPAVRPSHNLPSRPEGPIPTDRMLRAGADRPPERPPAYPRHDSRPGEQYGRLDRPGEPHRERDLIQGGRRHERSPGHRSRGRTPEGVHSLPPDSRDRREPVYGPPRHHGEPRDPRDIPRDPRDPRDQREYREPQYPRDLPRDQRGPPREPPRDGRPDPRANEWESGRIRGGSDPRGPLPPQYDDRGRPPLRAAPPPRDNGPPSRDNGPPPRDSVPPPRDSAPPPRESAPPPRDSAPPSRGSGLAPRDSNITPNNERGRSRQSSPPPGPVVNSDRLALINQELNRDSDRDRRDAARKAELNSRMEKEREAGREKRSSSRPQSPRRTDDRAPVRTDLARDDRGPPSNDRSQAPAPASGRDKREGPPPAGPMVDQLRSGPGRGRELIAPQPPARQPTDSNHGRLSSGFDARTQDPNYGRLNAASDVPSGPRGRGNNIPGNVNQGGNMGNHIGRGGRNFTAPQPHGGSRGMEPSSPAHVPQSPNQDRAPPLGPASQRDNRDRRSNAGTEQVQAPPTVPHGPAADQASGIHPSRLNQIPALQVNVPTGPANHGPPSASPFTPSGPRGSGHRQSPSVNNMQLPSPGGRNPPSGPSSAGPGKRDARFDGLKNTLMEAQMGNDRGTSIRGRGSRLSLQNAPPSPVTADPLPPPNRQDVPPSRSDPSKRPDLMTDRPHNSESGNSDPINDERSDSRGGARRREGSDRRRSHRSKSRSPHRQAIENSSRQREDLMAPSRVSGAPEERRDRERRPEGATGSDRDDRSHRRGRGSGRESGGRDDRDKERDRQEGGHPRGGGGGGGPREGGRHEEQPPRRGPPPMEGANQQPIYDSRNPPPPPPLPRDHRRESGRERKRGRGNEGELGGMENKRPRRSNQ